jgi:hypothetical protein
MAEALGREVGTVKSLIRRHVWLFDPTMGPMKNSFCVDGVALGVNHGHPILSSEEQRRSPSALDARLLNSDLRHSTLPLSLPQR